MLDRSADANTTPDNEPDKRAIVCSLERRRLLGDALVDDQASPVASAARSSFRLGWDAALHHLTSGPRDGDGLTTLEQRIALVIWEEFRKQYRGDAPYIEPRTIAQAITAAMFGDD